MEICRAYSSPEGGGNALEAVNFLGTTMTVNLASRGVQRHHYLYLYLFNQQNDLSLYLERRPDVGVVYTGSHVKSGKFCIF